jgi:hypothetical protein
MTVAGKLNHVHTQRITLELIVRRIGYGNGDGYGYGRDVKGRIRIKNAWKKRAGREARRRKEEV